MARPGFVGISDHGYRCGETHHHAKLSDADIDLMHELHQAGLTGAEIGRKFHISKSHACRILSGQSRVTIPMRWLRAPERK